MLPEVTKNAPPAALRTAFRGALAASLAARQDTAADRAAALREELQALSRRLVLIDRQLVTLSRRAQESPGLEQRLVTADDELARIIALPHVRDVAVVETTVKILTAPLHIDWDGARYHLGRYRVSLELQGDIQIESVDHRAPKPAWDHPHVQDRRPCLGNVREGVLKLVAEYELALATQVLLDFLALYQPESAYCPIEEWPRADVD